MIESEVSTHAMINIILKLVTHLKNYSTNYSVA